MRFAAPGEALFAARDADGMLIGIGGITRDPFADALRMRRFYVLPGMRGTGTGRSLAMEAIARARAAGVGLIRLRAPEGAWRFWEALGFAPITGDAAATHRMTLHVA
nr:GNAT family N-acetyltransferase [Neoroseomonas alba]